MPAPSHHGSQLSAPPPQTMLARRSPPPKFRPCMIIVVVLSLGLLFIGLTLTIIAHWPGYTGIGYNPLKIVGPCMLSLGGLVFIGCIVEVVRKNQSEKESFNRQMQERERMIQYANRTQSQMSLGRSYNPLPQVSGYIADESYDVRPNQYEVPVNRYDPPPPNNGYDRPPHGYEPPDQQQYELPAAPRDRQLSSVSDTPYIPEPVRPTRAKPQAEPSHEETEAERARRERKEKIRKQKELLNTSSQI